MSNLLAVYVAAMLLTLLGGMAFSAEPSLVKSDRRNAARVALLSPLWPLMLLWCAVIAFRGLWRTAEVGKDVPDTPENQKT